MQGERGGGAGVAVHHHLPLYPHTGPDPAAGAAAADGPLRPRVRGYQHHQQRPVTQSGAVHGPG